MPTGALTCTFCNQSGVLQWVEDGRGGTQAQLPAGFHIESRGALGPVVVCDSCDEIMPPPGNGSGP